MPLKNKAPLRGNWIPPVSGQRTGGWGSSTPSEKPTEDPNPKGGSFTVPDCPLKPK